MNETRPIDPSQYGEPGAAGATSSNLPLACSAEAIGTFLLVLVGTAVATAAVLGKGTGRASLQLPRRRVVLRADPYSDRRLARAHQRRARDPAVTFGLALAGKFPWAYVAPYWAAQLVGAAVGAVVVWAAYGQGAYIDAHLGAPSPVNGAGAMQVLLVEALIAFILVFTVISTTTDKRVPPGSAAVAIGFALAAGVLLGGPVSGGAGNPARALGPMIVAGTYPVWFFYCAGPLLGGGVAALTFRLVGMANAPKVAEVGSSKIKPLG